ncbi:MAG TPA: methyltransferase domain-containing protein [Ferruginibacter sp.]|nr:methyltransferase domain-containing protein [Ferruginibacter sp.]
MQEWIKKILQHTGIYHPLQSAYRKYLFSRQLKINQEKYAPLHGRGFHCNVCGERYEKFVPSAPAPENEKALRENAVIAGYGENIFCPNCGSNARERLVIAIISDDISIKNKRILHLSPEKNIFNFIKKEALVITSDLEPGFYRDVDQGIQSHNITHLGFENDYFDIIIGNHILEHIPDDALAMRELFRVLKPGGQAILQVPYSTKIVSTLENKDIKNPRQQSLLFGQKDHVRIYSLNDYVARLEWAGFIVAIRPYCQLEHYYINAVQVNECFLQIKKPSFFQ